MEKAAWKQWGTRYRQLLREKDQNLAKVAERMDMAESTLRSWTNGTREINLSDFFLLCEHGGLNASQVLFGGVPMSPELKQKIGELAKVMDADPAVSPSYGKLSKQLAKAAKT